MGSQVGVIKMFKFTKRRYLNRFFLNGEVQIGTLHDFRTREMQGALGDALDGTRHATINQNGLPHEWPEHAQAWNNAVGAIGGFAVRDMQVRQATVISPYPNVFAFCASRAITPNVIKSMETDQLDECYRIFDEDAFMEIVAYALTRAGFGVSSFEKRDVVYSPVHADAAQTPYIPPTPFDKPTGTPEDPSLFERQNERRYIWRCRKPVPDIVGPNGAKTIIIHIPQAHEFVTHIPRDKWESWCE